MKTVLELVGERDAALQDAANVIEQVEADERQMEEAEEHRYNLAIQKAENLNKQIEQRQKFEAASAPTFAANQQHAGTRGDPTAALPNDEIKPAAASPEVTRPRIEIPRAYGKLQAFPKTPDGEFRAYKVGKWLQATIYGNEQAKQWCRDNGVGIRAALAGGINIAGGVLVPEEMERAVIDMREVYGVFRRACRVVPMGSDTREYPRKTGQLTAYFTGEGADATQSQQTFDNVKLVAKELVALTVMSRAIDEDAVVDLADMTATDMAWAFAYKEDTVGFTGTGISTDGGIVGVLVRAIDGNHTQATVAAASGHDQFSELDGDDLLSMMAKVAQYAKPGSAWFVSPTCSTLTLDAIRIAAGGNTIATISAGTDALPFMGYPVFVSPVFPDVTTALNGAAMLAFGNLSLAAMMGQRRGISIEMSTERYFEKRQIAIMATERIDINVHNLGSSSVKSPICVITGLT